MEIYAITQSGTITALIAKVQAGQPQEVTSEVQKIDPLTVLTKGSDMCVLVRVRGESMTPLVADGDWCVIDRAREPQNGDVVLANLNGGYTLKTFEKKRGLFLVPANDLHEKRKVEELDEFGIIGTVIMILHPLV